MLQKQSIQRKLTVIIMLTSSIALLLAGTAFVVFELISFHTRGNIFFRPPPLLADDYAFTSNSLKLFRHVHYKGARIGTIYIESDLEALTSRLWQYLGIVLMVLCASTLVAFLVSSRLQ